MGSINELVRQLRDPAPNVRINALHVLGKFGESTAALISALADPTTSVRRHAIAVLEKNRQ